jgi:hypothetical protein
MNTERIKEIQQATAYPESVSVQQALLKVWNETEHEQLRIGAVSGSLPTEEQVLQTIFDCVFIRGIELEDYKRNFTNEQSGLYDAIVKLFSGNDR